jgi:hypothetical protein
VVQDRFARLALLVLHTQSSVVNGSVILNNNIKVTRALDIRNHVVTITGKVAQVKIKAHLCTLRPARAAQGGKTTTPPGHTVGTKDKGICLCKGHVGSAHANLESGSSDWAWASNALGEGVAKAAVVNKVVKESGCTGRAAVEEAAGQKGGRGRGDFIVWGGCIVISNAG